MRSRSFLRTSGPVWSPSGEPFLDDLESDPMRTADRLDWAAKYQLLREFRDRDDLAWDDPKLAMIALQYHDTDPEKGLAYRLEKRGRLRRLFTDDEVEAATVVPPSGTRAYFRGRCVAQYPQSLVAANWDSLVFDTGESSLKRVPYDGAAPRYRKLGRGNTRRVARGRRPYRIVGRIMTAQEITLNGHRSGWPARS